MDDSRFTSRHLRIYVTALFGHFMDGFVINMTGVLIPGLIVTFHLTSKQAGHFSSSLFAGMLVGAAVAGSASDRFGRRFPLFVSIMTYAVFSFAAVFAESYDSLLVFRTLQGVGLGAEIAIVLPYITEFVPSRHRGPLVTLASAAWICGLPASAAVGRLLMPHSSWRSMFAVGSISAVAAVLIVTRLPESVRYLLRTGRVREARALVDTIASPEPAAGMRPAAAVAPAPAEAGRATGSVRFLLGRSYLRYTLSIWLMELCAGAFLYGMSSWLPSILERRGVGLLRSFSYTAIITFAAVVGAIVAGQLVNRVGRRSVMSSSFLLGGVVCLIWGTTSATAAVVALGSVAQFFGSGVAGATLFAYASELYPTESRATGLGWAAAWQKAGGLVMPTAVGYVLAMHASSYVFFVLFGAISLLAGVSALAATFETRDKTVEQITRELARRVGREPATAPAVGSGAVGETGDL
ncbi:MFS transporter [Actinoallomurus acaciae]|uniref:MFS transporter n=1 Tax=Actinoallomurus acaciae TaxID=502577 RepID=A0ABV5YVC7_9ACTN